MSCLVSPEVDLNPNRPAQSDPAYLGKEEVVEGESLSHPKKSPPFQLSYVMSNQTSHRQWFSTLTTLDSKERSFALEKNGFH